MTFIHLLILVLLVTYIGLAIWVFKCRNNMKHVLIGWTLAFTAMGISVIIVSYNIGLVTKQIHSAKKVECVNGHLFDGNGRPIIDLMRVPVTCYTMKSSYAAE